MIARTKGGASAPAFALQDVRSGLLFNRADYRSHGVWLPTTTQPTFASAEAVLTFARQNQFQAGTYRAVELRAGAPVVEPMPPVIVLTTDPGWDAELLACSHACPECGERYDDEYVAQACCTVQGMG